MEKLTKKFVPGKDGVVALTDKLVAVELTKSVDIEFERIYLQHNIAKSALNRIFSIRDLYGVPVATLEVSIRHVVNCYGKNKQKPDASVIPAIQQFVFQNNFSAYPDAASNMDMIHLNNKLYDLNNLPRDLTVNGDIYMADMGLTKLPDMSGLTVNGDFIVMNNNLSDLRGSPRVVRGNYICSWCNLTSVTGMPEIVGKTFDCSNNKLTKIDAPFNHIGGDFIAINNQISTLDGMPLRVGNKVDLSGNVFADFWTGKINDDCVVPRHIAKYKQTVGIDMDEVKRRLNAPSPKSEFDAKVIEYENRTSGVQNNQTKNTKQNITLLSQAKNTLGRLIQNVRKKVR